MSTSNPNPTPRPQRHRPHLRSFVLSKDTEVIFTPSGGSILHDNTTEDCFTLSSHETQQLLEVLFREAARRNVHKNEQNPETEGAK